jgi:importin subunit alpha-6/7
MVQGVFSSNTDEQLAATAKFRKILSKERNPPIERVIECGVLPRFVEFLTSPHNTLQVRPASDTHNISLKQPGLSQISPLGPRSRQPR